jgi:hypothetical protein
MKRKTVALFAGHLRLARPFNWEGRNEAEDSGAFLALALDPETKIVPAYRVGKRDLPTATAVITDLSERLANRVQLSSDALGAYVEATERAFGADIDYGQV